MNKLLIISHTEHYKNANGVIVGWGPTVTEINYLSQIFDKIWHAAPLHQNTAPKSSKPYVAGIEYVPLKPSGGKGIQKMSIIRQIPYNLNQISKYAPQATIIQFRAPTGIGVYLLPWLKFINNTDYWVKYAGNWGAKALPLGNRLQRWWLKNMLSLNTKVTVNGFWASNKRNIISFENPCLTEDDRALGKQLITSKKPTKPYNYCFVGGLNNNKGVALIIDAFCKIKHSNIGTLHIVGDGILRTQLELKATKIQTPIIFHGFLNKAAIVEIYKACHFILLPSKSEGFPKVIGEAMNFGCIPIVSNVSCIGQYIQNEKNGFLIKPLSEENIMNALQQSLSISKIDFKNYIEHNYKKAENFTFNHYLERIQKEIVG
ncbi:MULTISPECIES: glycosyltransferase [Flavobacteriaceae]|uniref:Glycosyltransferase n=2 Tax=Flavobacteriaceae TaxID=49546 RepID=A0A4Y8AVR8_9FLAO|nr:MULTISPECIES: glycosyltransferase [Flavobacteriaceae]TEW76591.1 glycosyltransferase [Gramella jeungdoensis]GGK51702.1 hypothetical protein GCM10007963_20110 [Lutibacter litoralis]